MENRKAKLSDFIFTELFLGDAVEKSLIPTRSRVGGGKPALPNKTLDKFKSLQNLLAESQEYPTLRFAPVQNVTVTYLEC